MIKQTVLEAIAGRFLAMRNCETSGNAEWRGKHREAIELLMLDHMPRGSGFDAATAFSFDASRDDCLRFNTSFHHMNDAGMYDGWTDHVVTVRAGFLGPVISVSGRNRNLIKDYIAETFEYALRQVVTSSDRDASRYVLVRE